ncbi:MULTISPECIES: response regulator transcription factor [Actinomycetes]|uniref:Response regulator n=2 Tax=Actinomycetes TaxID=1760 RepID=A0ABP6M5N4_9MICC|nr:response regulator [Nesterenkonia sp. CL21]MDS2174049.1 response regulator [Nesterenkonia sp. CL21]
MGSATTALIIEDDDDIRRLLEMVLTQMGFQVDSVSEGGEGLRLAEHTDYSLLSVDVGLPDMDGHQLVRRVRDSFSGKIVMISARASAADEAAGRDAGTDAYITKPFRPRELRASLTELLTEG